MTFSAILDALKDIGPLITAAGVLVAVWTLRANHDWNRRNYTVGLVATWNDKTSSHRKAIERLRPGLIDLDRKGEITELTKKDAIAIYTSKVDTVEWELRFHFIELLNHFEAIASAYRNRVGDSQMIEESLRSVLVRWHDILLHFMEVVKEQSGLRAVGAIHDRSGVLEEEAIQAEGIHGLTAAAADERRGENKRTWIDCQRRSRLSGMALSSGKVGTD